MYSLRSRVRSIICTSCLRHNNKTTSRLSHFTRSATPTTPPYHHLTSAMNQRPYSTKTPADSLIEDIQDQYATARDEFEIAVEETEKKTVYAADDRQAAREELDKLKTMYDEALSGPHGEEIKGRIGQRIRELDNAIEALEKSAIED